MNWKKLFRKRVLLILALFTIVVFGGSGVYGLLTPTLRLTALIAKDTFQAEESVNITISIRNIGLWPITFTYHPPLFDFVVYDGAGKEIFRFGDFLAIPLWDRPVTLWPTQTTTKTLTWDQEGYREAEGVYKVPKGTYTIMALTTVIYINRDFLFTAQPIKVTIE